MTPSGYIGRGRPPALLLIAALAAAGCGDTLVDHNGGTFVQACNQPGQHSCDRGAGAVCEPVSETSCGDGLACTDCTAGFSVANATPICQGGGTCGYECDPGWLRCDAGCCRAIAVTAGTAHTCAIVAQLSATSGQLKCWGANDRGQLGTGDTADRLVPASVANMNSGVTLVAAGAKHTCAVKGGALYCWGANGEGSVDGRLGVTTSLIQYDYPQTVNLAGATALAPGERHTCALASGNVFCWGANDRGQLGFATVPSGSSVLRPPSTPTLTGVSVLVSGRAHSCALTAAGVSCWGGNDWGQLGNGATVPGPDQPSPVAVTGLPAISALAAGAHHACAIDTTANQYLWCWGENTDGQLGRGTVGGAFSTPAVAADIQSLRPVAAAGGRAHTCGNKGDVNGIKCVGSNASGQLGAPGPTITKSDVQIGQAATAMAAGDDHACAVAADGSLFCWGADARGQVGDGSASSSLFSPTLVSGR